MHDDLLAGISRVHGFLREIFEGLYNDNLNFRQYVAVLSNFMQHLRIPFESESVKRISILCRLSRRWKHQLHATACGKIRT